MRRSRLVFALVLGWLAAAVAVAGAAWACTPYAAISVSPQQGPAGSQLTVEGRAFRNSHAVEIRWGSADGPVLATATGPSFSAPVTVPDADPGVHTIVALQRTSHGSATGGRGAAQFEVTEAAAAAGQSPAPAPGQAPAPAPAAQEPPARAADPAPAPAGGAERRAEAAPSGAPARGEAPAPPPAVVPATAAEPDPAPPAPVEPAATAEAAPRPGAALFGNLWDGFASSGASPARARPGDASAVPAQGTSSPLALGAVLLSLGLTMLAFAGGLAHVSGRRAVAISTAGSKGRPAQALPGPEPDGHHQSDSRAPEAAPI